MQTRCFKEGCVSLGCGPGDGLQRRAAGELEARWVGVLAAGAAVHISRVRKANLLQENPAYRRKTAGKWCEWC